MGAEPKPQEASPPPEATARADQQGLEEKDKEARTLARVELTGLLRMARATVTVRPDES